MKLGTLTHPHLAEAYAEMEGQSVTPLWEIFGTLVSPEPKPIGQAHLWRYDALRPLLMRAGAEISAEEAERRVLTLNNPGLDRPGIAQTLIAGLQLVLPGEVAPAHRHTQGAIRFVLESTGGYTAVEGERCEMRRGDFITTPSWTWHDHENTGDGPMIWLDGLDVPMVNFFGAPFAEENDRAQQPIHRVDGDSAQRWGQGLKPYTDPDTDLGAKPYSPIFSYPYARARAALMTLAASDPADPRHGWKLVYANPRDGGHVLPTLAAFLQYIPGGMTTAATRTTENTVYTVVEGAGVAQVGETALRFAENDVFVVPNWMPLALEAARDCVLFSYSDRAAQERLGIWRDG